MRLNRAQYTTKIKEVGAFPHTMRVAYLPPFPAELAVLRLIAEGRADREIATRLCIAESTVKKHVSNMMPKLRARNRTHLAMKAIALGVIDFPSIT